MNEVRIKLKDDKYVFEFIENDGLITKLSDVYETIDERSLIYGFYRVISFLLEGKENE